MVARVQLYHGKKRVKQDFYKQYTRNKKKRTNLAYVQRQHFLCFLFLFLCAMECSVSLKVTCTISLKIKHFCFIKFIYLFYYYFKEVFQFCCPFEFGHWTCYIFFSTNFNFFSTFFFNFIEIYPTYFYDILEESKLNYVTTFFFFTMFTIQSIQKTLFHSLCLVCL